MRGTSPALSVLLVIPLAAILSGETLSLCGLIGIGLVSGVADPVSVEQRQRFGCIGAGEDKGACLVDREPPIPLAVEEVSVEVWRELPE